MAVQRVFAIDELAPFTGTSVKSTIWRWVRDGLFPEPVRVGHEKIVWLESDLEKWQQAQRAKPYVKLHGVGGRPKGTTKAVLEQRKKPVASKQRREAA